MHRELPPRNACEEEDGGGGAPVEERAPEVRLLEDEHHRNRGQTDDGPRDAPLADPPAAVGDEPREEEDEQDLAELGRLEVEGAERDPALGPAHALRERKDEQEEDDGQAVEDTAVTAEDVRVHGRHDAEHDRPDGDVDLLTEDVVVRIAGDVVPGNRPEHPEAVGDDRPDRREQEVVDVAQERADLGRRLRPGCRLRKRPSRH